MFQLHPSVQAGVDSRGKLRLPSFVPLVPPLVENDGRRGFSRNK